MKRLDFEAPLTELYDKIDQLKAMAKESQIEIEPEIKKIEKRAIDLKKEIYSNLTPTQIMQISRHPTRPDSLSLAQLITDEWIELHGDRLFKDDPAIISGIGLIKGTRVAIIGNQKGHDTKENIYRNFGMANPEGYRKALRVMRLAQRFKMPIITFVDTPGAYPGIEAEEHGQAEAIARNLKEMMGLDVPILSFVIGEGGSGGALGIAVANKVYMLQYAVYSVISPEGCASILFRDAKMSPTAADSLKITAPDIVRLGIADGIIPEPVGGAHYDWKETASTIKKTIVKDLASYATHSGRELIDERYAKFRAMGQYLEG
jgi:acetyl-CoA carboxylase carboxyl transferase subunit alpha